MGRIHGALKYSLCKFEHLRRNLLPICDYTVELPKRYVFRYLTTQTFRSRSGTQFGGVDLIECTTSLLGAHAIITIFAKLRRLHKGAI